MIGVWVVPLVCKTFSENPVESRKLLQNILERIRQPGTPTEEIYRLTHEIKHLWPHDPDFVADIYKAVFEYEETSREILSFSFNDKTARYLPDGSYV